MDLHTRLSSIGDSIKEILGKKEPKPDDIKLSMAAVLNDGTNVMFEPEIQLGAFVFKTDGEGTLPLSDGEYMLSERNLKVTVYQGKVSLLSEQTETANTVDLSAIETKLAAIELKAETVTSFEAKLSAQSTLIESQNATIAKQSEMISGLYDVVLELSKSKPTREVESPAASSSNSDDRIEGIMNGLKTLKNDKLKNN